MNLKLSDITTFWTNKLSDKISSEKIDYWKVFDFNVSGACRSFVVYLDRVAISPFTYFKRSKYFLHLFGNIQNSSPFIEIDRSRKISLAKQL